MNMCTRLRTLAALVNTAGILWMSTALPALASEPAQPERASWWIDALRGEPISFEELTSDLEQARVVYLGEVHSISRHHALQRQLLQALVQNGRKLVLAMEQFEAPMQPALDRFNAGAIDLETMVRDTGLARRWAGHINYLPLLAVAREARVPVLALNARPETIRAVGRSGLAGVSTDQRRELPESIQLDDPVYERLLTQTLSVHMAFDPKKLRPVFEAQVARDETMAQRLTEFLNSPAGQDRNALVICGRGHCEYGLGIPSRIARRLPGVAQRTIVFSESGDLELSDAERKQAREIEISHAFLKEIGRPVADYLHVVAPR